MIALPAQSMDETMSAQDGPQRDPSHPPFHSPQSERDGNFTPSISPLSTTSRTNNGYFPESNQPRQSPAANTKAIGVEQAAPNTVPEDAEEDMADVVMQDDHDDGSSSLSDFEGNFDDQENKDSGMRPTPPPMEEADSEAETERLEHTPQKPWTNPDTGRSPSKLNQETTMEEDLSEPASSPKSPGRHSQSRSPSHRLSASPSPMAGQKRKRSPPPSEPDSPLSDAASDSEEMLAQVRANGSTITLGPAMQDFGQDSKDDAATVESARETPEPDDMDENPYISPMKAARLKGKKQKAKKQQKEPTLAQRQDYEAEYDDLAEGDDMQDDDDSAAKSEEDREIKRQARLEYTSLAEKFQIFRAKLQGEKVAAAEAELEQLTCPQPTHPDFVGQLQCITQRRDTKFQHEYALAYYKKQALCNSILAERAQLHAQYYQEAREARENHLASLGKEWYDIQKERRQFQADQADKYTFKFPSKFSDQIRNQANYNREVSILAGLQRHVGFPAAPEVHGSRPNELDDDLRAMKIPQKQLQPAQQPPLYPNHMDTNGMPARTAQERWVEQNPWANAQHPSHHQSRTPAPFPAYAPYHTQPANPSVALFRQGSAQGHSANSPFTTPLPHPQKRADVHANGLGSSDTIGVPSDPPSSVPAAPPTTDRNLTAISPPHDASPIDALKVRAAIHNPLASRQDRRNFSNMSSASTIDAPNEENTDRPHHPYAALPHGPIPPSLPVEPPATQQGFLASALHAQHGKPDERRSELYESMNFRPQMGTYGTPVPLFAGGSPVRQEGQRAT